MVNWLLITILFPYGLIMLSALIFAYQIWTWNIPVGVFRFTGDKRRPMFVPTKARKFTRHGVTQLKVRGYKPIRDFKNENYYPAHKKKFGALVLFEFEDGQLTPVLPSLEELSSIPGHQELLEKVRAMCANVDFVFDPSVYHQLRLNMVDDTDKDFEVQNLARQQVQYTTMFERFLALASSPGVILFIVLVFFLVGFVLWLKEDPANAARACVESTRPLVERMAESMASGAPPG